MRLPRRFAPRNDGGQMRSKKFEKELEKYINRLFPSGKLKDAALYSLFPGGKRLRPKLVYLFGKALGVPARELTPLACAIEMIHSYTLIHDDLPAMDDDDYRRGKLTVHKKFNEATAILLGDALLTQAFEVLASLRSPELVALVARAVGAQGVIYGQVLDIDLASNAGKKDSNHFKNIYRLKTAKLFEAAILGPAYLTDGLGSFPPIRHPGGSRGPDNSLKIKLSDFAMTFGLCFQVADDLQDAYEEHRKQTPTLATVLGLKKTEKLLNTQLLLMRNNLDALPFTKTHRHNILRLLQVIPGFSSATKN